MTGDEVEGAGLFGGLAKALWLKAKNRQQLASMVVIARLILIIFIAPSPLSDFCP